MTTTKYGYLLPRVPGMYDPVAACDECCVQDFGPTLTQQSQAAEADINEIVRRFGLTGQMPENIRPPVYADFDDVYDYKSAQDAIALANSSFMKMPAAIRARFDNDPQQFLEYASNPENIDGLRELGLAVPKAPQEPHQEAPTAGTAGNPAPDPGAGGKGVQGGPGTP